MTLCETVQYSAPLISKKRDAIVTDTTMLSFVVYARLDSIVIGPGLGRNIVVLSAVAEIIKEARLAEKRYSAVQRGVRERQRET